MFFAVLDFMEVEGINDILLKGEELEIVKKLEGCDKCGGKKVMIRGQFPGRPERKVCPTCTEEKMERLMDQSQESKTAEA